MPKRHGFKAGDFTTLFRRLEEVIIAGSGADPYETILRLVIAKAIDEREQRGVFAHPDAPQLTAAIDACLAQAAARWSDLLEAPFTIDLAPNQLRECARILAQFTIATAHFEALDHFFESLVSETAKGRKGQYFTPRHVVDFCVKMLAPQPGESVVDPACGSGGFLVHSVPYTKRLWGFDIDAKSVRIAKLLMILAGGDPAHILRANSLLKTANAHERTIEHLAGSERFDIVLTNPPFAGDVTDGALLDAFSIAAGKSRIERDVLFIERCLELLKPHGRLAIVLPANKFSGPATSYIRKWLVQRAEILAVVALGRNTFLPHTHQKANILFARKRAAAALPADVQPIFFAVSERDGKNSRGVEVVRDPKASESWSRLDHDLEEIVAAYRSQVGSVI